MELQARVAALEEEVSILKGEIKAILQEVRVAVLARQNPFLDATVETPGAPTAHTHTEAPPAPKPEARADSPAPPTPIRPVSRTEDPVEQLWMPEPDQSIDTRQSWEPNTGPRPLDLAALLAWVQDVSQRFSEADFAILLSIGAYGGMIEEDLKDTLLELAENLPSDETHRATLPEFTLALQQLEALRDSAPARRPAGRRTAA